MARSTTTTGSKVEKAEAAAVQERQKEQDKLLEETTKAREEEVEKLEKEHDDDDEKHTVTGGVREPVSPTPSYVTAEVGGVERIIAPVRPAWTPAPVKADPAARLEAKKRAERADQAREARTKAL